MNTKLSSELFVRAQSVIPGGVNSPVRAFRAVGGIPRFIDRAEGAYIYDVDGNRYIDYVGSWGPMILGHAHPHVIRAVMAAAARGTSFGAPTELEVRLAEAVVQAVPSMELVRFVNSGTEATMSAIRVARAYTGREMVVKFAGCYHGHADMLLVSAGSGVMTLGMPDSPGVPPGATATTLVAPYNDAATFEQLLAQYRGQIAAVIVEPVAGNMGCVPPVAGFLQSLRTTTEREGILLIFDEVMTGFRVAYGGAQQRYGIKPDLTCLGKVVGGGLPAAAYGGRGDIMAMVAPSGPVYQAGTLSGNPLAMAAGLAQLELLRDSAVYDQLEDMGARLEHGISDAAHSQDVATVATRVGSMFSHFFTDWPVVDETSAKRADIVLFARYFQAMLRRGIYLAPSQFESVFVSLAHSADDIEQTIAAAREAFGDVASAEGK